MFFWQNYKQLKIVSEYRNVFHKYVESYSKENLKKLAELRSKLITDAPKVENAFISSNVPHWMDYGSPASGYRKMSITHELPEFVKNQFDILGNSDDTLQKIDDMYLRVISIYSNNVKRSIINTFNPFLYVNYLVSILFLPIFTIFDIKPEKRENGIWHLLQILMRFPAYYVTVIHNIIVIFGKGDFEKELFNNILLFIKNR